MEPELLRAFGRLEGKFDEVHKIFVQHMEDDKENFNKLHKKVDTLQGKWKYAAGAVGVITFLIGNFGWNLVQTFLPR